MPLRAHLLDLAAALDAGGETARAQRARSAADGTEPELLTFLTSNELWGGAGSIADQAGGGGDRSPQRKAIEAVLVALGKEQIRVGTVNSRIEMWVSAFDNWSRSGI